MRMFLGSRDGFLMPRWLGWKRFGILSAADSGRVLLSVAALIAIAGATILVLRYSGGEPTQAAVDPSMSLRVFRDAGKTQEVACVGSGVGRTCEVIDGTGTVFSIDVVTDPPPPAPTGYTAYQVTLQYTSSLPLQQQGGFDENRWPDCNLVTATENKDVANRYRITCGVGLGQPASNFAGTLVNVQFQCQGSPGQIDLIGGTKGQSSRYVVPGPSPIVFLPSVDKGGKDVVDSVDISCVDPTPTPTPTKQPPPGDTDGDGCSDQQENGADETLGGQRDYLNPWDFYDTNDDRIVDLFNDIVGVVERFGLSEGDEGYDPAFDRGPSTGPNLWNLTGPDGVTDLFNDIVGVIVQHGHDCRL